MTTQDLEEATQSTGPGKDPGSSAQRYVIAGRYLLEREIARGAMGRVFLATELAIKRQIAVKVMTPRPGAGSEDNFEQRFMLEARSVAQLTHRNIVTVHDYGKTDNGLLYMAMEFLDGPTLGEAMKSVGGPFPVTRACHIAVCVARALRAAHRQHLVHRDLKPGNIILLPDPDDGDMVKVLDFGLAKVFEQEEEEDEFAPLTREGLMLGTPRYMAPEQIVGRDITPATDIYALGACLYQMFAGRPPYEGASDIEILHSQLKEDPTPIPELPGMEDFPPLLWGVVRMCLRRDAASRYATAQSFIDDLRGAIGVCYRDARYRPAFGEGLLPSSLTAALNDASPSTIVDVGDLGMSKPGTNPTAEIDADLDIDFGDEGDSDVEDEAVAIAKPAGRPLAVYAAPVVILLVLAALGYRYQQASVPPPPPKIVEVDPPPLKPKPVRVETTPNGLEIIDMNDEVLGETPALLDVTGTQLIRFRKGSRTSLARALVADEGDQVFEVKDLRRRAK